MTKIPRSSAVTSPARISCVGAGPGGAFCRFCRASRAPRPRAIGVVEVAPGIFVHQGKYADVNPENRGDISNAEFHRRQGGRGRHRYRRQRRDRARPARRDRARSPTSRSAMSSTPTCTPITCLETPPSRAREPNLSPITKCPRLSPPAPKAICSNKRIGWETKDFAGTKIVLPTEAVTETLDLDLGGRVANTPRPAHGSHRQRPDDLRQRDRHAASRRSFVFGPRPDDRRLDRRLAEAHSRSEAGNGGARRARAWPADDDMAERWTRCSAISKRLRDDVRATIKDGKTLEQAVATAGQSEKGQVAAVRRASRTQRDGGVHRTRMGIEQPKGATACALSSSVSLIGIAARPEHQKQRNSPSTCARFKLWTFSCIAATCPATYSPPRSPTDIIVSASSYSSHGRIAAI